MGNVLRRLGAIVLPFGPICRYRTLSKLGEGNFGVVYKIQNNFTGKLLAMKLVSSKSILDAEFEILPLDHANIITISKVYNLKNSCNGVINEPSDVEFPTVAIILELCDTSLHERIYESYMSTTWMYSCFNQILDGLAYLHSEQIVHGNLKPENILFTNNLAKITDFGLAKKGVLSKPYHHVEENGRKVYCSPETIRNGELSDKKIDVFSFGIIWAEMWLRKGTKVERELFFKWAEILPLSFTVIMQVPHIEQELIFNMTKCDPLDRFSIEQILVSKRRKKF